MRYRKYNNLKLSKTRNSLFNNELVKYNNLVNLF